jgi:hypothetical protein
MPQTTEKVAYTAAEEQVSLRIVAASVHRPMQKQVQTGTQPYSKQNQGPVGLQ